MANQPTPQHFEPIPLTLEQAAHLFKLSCTPSQLADLQDGVDSVIAVLTEIDALNYYITRTMKDELLNLANALHSITDEPTIHFEGNAYQIVVPTDDTQPLSMLSTDDDLRWLDRFVPDSDKV